MRRFVCLIAFCLLPAAAMAQDAPDPAACLAEQVAAQQPVADCVNRSQAECFEYVQGSAPGIVCFRNFKRQWSDLIARQLALLSVAAPEDITRIAEIEVKYDLLQNLAQCDRMIELELVRRDKNEAVQHAEARCQATAVGLVYMKLLLQSPTPE